MDPPSPFALFLGFALLASLWLAHAGYAVTSTLWLLVVGVLERVGHRDPGLGDVRGFVASTPLGCLCKAGMAKIGTPFSAATSRLGSEWCAKKKGLSGDRSWG